MDDKLRKLEASAMKLANAECDRIKQELSEFEKRELRGADVGNDDAPDSETRREISAAKRRVTRELSRKSAEYKRALRQKRSEYMAEIFAEARRRLVEFTLTDGYEEYLLNKVKTLDERYRIPGTNILIRGCDAKFSDRLKALFREDCDVLTSEDVEIGGVIFFNPERRYIIDMRLGTALTEQKEWFYEQWLEVNENHGE